ncbi:T9SS-dependent choice-of-anchor J family protein [Psychroserpens sp. NJDZ02]|uniref:T9SS-dependent choice-of-anchor J family protein n=1 Tax=Psychroserpens sp. NJDZ02 TaxID=2570561 RepID=UPI0010A90B5F|nr:choice-of-anchor J domain-containing protein [Psychroserpens sp. NJDZ02]QCE40584.1 T9SS type A sorting domain-containing protein [Psychroserpens sp. NJDZ02]
MKKITLLLLIYLTMTTLSHAQFPESFNGTSIPTNWTTFIGTNGEGTVKNWANVGDYMGVTYEAVPTLSEDWLVTPSIAITTSNSLLQFDQTDAFLPDYGSEYTIRVSTGSSQTTHADFTIIDTQTETSVTAGNEATFSSYTVDLSAYEGLTVYIAFVLAQNDGDYWFIDNVNLVNQYASPPNAVTTPTPSDTATDVAIDPTDTDSDNIPDNIVSFSWSESTTGDPAITYNFYLGESPTTLVYLRNINNTSVDITGTEYNTVYYWSVVAENIGGQATGSSVWSFTTEADNTLSVTNFNTTTFSIYPNPAKNSISIKSNTRFDSVEIFNQLGQRVMQLNANAVINNSIAINDLKNGVYFMKILAGNQEKTIKFIKE